MIFLAACAPPSSHRWMQVGPRDWHSDETGDLAKVNAAVADLGLGNRLHIVTVPGGDILDWCLARYRIDAVEIVATHQPILYLDVDVICDAPLHVCAFDLPNPARSRSCRKGASTKVNNIIGTLVRRGPDGGGWPRLRSIGTRLFIWHTWPSRTKEFGAGGVQCDLAFGLSSLGANRRSQIRFAGYDQPFAGYVMKKLRLTSSDLLPAKAQFLPCRYGNDAVASGGPALGPCPFQRNCR